MSVGEPHIVQLVDLRKYHSNPDGTLEYDRHAADREKHKFFRLPMDFPGYLRALRILKPNEGTLAASAHVQTATTLEVDCFTFGVKVFIRAGFVGDRTLKIIVEDSEGRTCVASYER